MQNKTTDKDGIHILTELLVSKGFRHVVLSPGSRNAPLIVAFAREPRISHYVVVDERSAAFFALGIAQRTGEGVALVCTSGTALLNYAPGVAEAYYQRLPLLIISADRPVQWIDQEDSQTIRQNEILRNIVKRSYHIPVVFHTDEERWYANREINDAINCSLSKRKGPVHINIPLDEPLYNLRTYPNIKERVISSISTIGSIPDTEMALLQEKVNSSAKVMIIAGFCPVDLSLKKSLEKLSRMEQIVILTENISNLDSPHYITTIDRDLAVIQDSEYDLFSPDILISFGGALVSKRIKSFLRNATIQEHWLIEECDKAADTFKALTTHINTSPSLFFDQLSDLSRSEPSGYSGKWKELSREASKRHRLFIEGASWSDLKAFSFIMDSLPRGCSLQISNGTPIRYTQLFEQSQVTRRNGNRGTSGIDGATSTAVGASCVDKGLTVFITGDISLMYDSNALWNKYISSRLKIIVMNNGGGGIFRYIPGPSQWEELEEFFETPQTVQIKDLARTYHLSYFEANSPEELRNILPHFYSEQEQSCILEIKTPRFENDRVLKAYFNYLQTKR